MISVLAKSIRGFSTVLCLLLCLSWAHGQRGGRGGSHHSVSNHTHSSKSRSSLTGIVHVHGYYRKNGTYVQPHYRTAPDGIVENNWSFKGNVNPFTGKVGTKGYPLGAWLSPRDGKTVYNTPFIGLNGDYETTTKIFVTSSSEAGIPAGSILTHHRSSPSSAYQSIESWNDLGATAMASGQSDWYVKGYTPKGQTFESKLQVMPETTWSGSMVLEDNSDKESDRPAVIGTLFQEIEADPNPSIARIARAGRYNGELEGATILEIRRLGTNDYVKVATWKDVEAYVNKFDCKNVVVKGVDVRGQAYTCLLNCLTKRTSMK